MTAIIEAAAWAAAEEAQSIGLSLDGIVIEVLAAVTPLIRAQVLEEAATVAEREGGGFMGDGSWIADCIRALKEQP